MKEIKQMLDALGATGRIIVGLILTILSAFYLLPGAIAIMRGRSSTLAIFVLNLLLGWTFVGWVVAPVWALKADPADLPPRQT
jgi:hypothetical protein